MSNSLPEYKRSVILDKAPQNTIFVAEVGAYAHDLVTEYSDHDFGGLFVIPLKKYLSVEGYGRDTIDSSSPDSLYDYYYHDVSKFVKLACKGNPSALSLLWTPLVCYSTQWSDSLRSIRTAFLSKRILDAYFGYYNAQKARLNSGKLVHTSGGRYTAQYGAHMMRLMFAAYHVAQTSEVLVRLTGSIQNEVKSCKLGEMSKEQVLSRCEELQKKASEAESKTKLPDLPDYNSINSWLYEVRQAFP